MTLRHGQSRGSLITLHGGAGSWDTKSKDALRNATQALRTLAREALDRLEAGDAPLDVVVRCLKGLESDPQFNAGFGAALQADGQARLTASLMDGVRGTFSGVMGVTALTHPSLLAQSLQNHDSRVLIPPGTEMLARGLGLPVASNVTPERLREWYENAKTEARFCDTVGCVLRTADGRLYAGTSTGGRGYEFPGRVGDSATVAGTYCSEFAGVSATGVGEEIVDDAVAARLETRRRDGATLEAASQKAYAEARERKRSYGWIALDRDGCWTIAHTTQAMSYVVLADGADLAASD